MHLLRAPGLEANVMDIRNCYSTSSHPILRFMMGAARTTREVDRELFDFTVAAYGEFGITSKLTLRATIPFILVSTGGRTDPLNSTPNLTSSNLAALGNVSVFGKYTLIDQSVNVALIGQLDLPTSDRDPESGLSTGVMQLPFSPNFQ